MQFVNHIDDLTQIEARLYLVVQLVENLANLEFKRIGACSRCLQAFEEREQFVVNKLHEVVARHGVDNVYLAVGSLWGSPLRPAVEACDDALVLLAFKLSLVQPRPRARSQGRQDT